MDALAGAALSQLQKMGAAADAQARTKSKGFEVGYDLFAINGENAWVWRAHQGAHTGGSQCFELGTAERISAIVEMNHPGVWVLGDLDEDDRSHGMGIVVEYAGR